VVVSALGYSGILSLSKFIYYTPYVFTMKTWPQVWRIVTSFFITKPKFGILMDPYFCTHTTHPLPAAQADSPQYISMAAV
jgi:Derlin-2/3